MRRVTERPAKPKTLYIKYRPTTFIIPAPHHKVSVNEILELMDGSLVTPFETDIMQWMMPSDGQYPKRLQPVGTFLGHTQVIRCMLEKDNETLVSGSHDMTLRVWNKATYQSICTVSVGSEVHCLTKTKQLEIVCGLRDGRVQIYRGDIDLILVSSFNLHSGESVSGVHELVDGSFLSGSRGGLKRWNKEGIVLQQYSAVFGGMWGIVELQQNLIAMASYKKIVKVFNVSTGECISSPLTKAISGLIKLSNDKFVTSSVNGTIQVWNEKGELLETIKDSYERSELLLAMARIRGCIATVSVRGIIEMRRLK